MLENLISLTKIRNIIKNKFVSYSLAFSLSVIPAFAYLNCDSGSGTGTTLECKINNDCQSGYECIANKCENKVPIANAGNDQPLNFDKACFDTKNYDNNGNCLTGSGYSIKNNIHPVSSNSNPTPRQKITLDGSLSSDPEGKALRYLWRQISGPIGIAFDNSIVKPEFTTPMSGDYVFGLMVSDGEKESTEDTVNIYVRDNLKPVFAYPTYYIVSETEVSVEVPDYYDIDGYIVSCRLSLETCEGPQGVCVFRDFYNYLETTTNAPDGNFDCKTIIKILDSDPNYVEKIIGYGAGVVDDG